MAVALSLALLLVALSVGLMRVGWGGDRRIAWLGWLGAVGAVAWLGALEGAWGIATGFVAGTAIALAIILHAAALAPAGKRHIAIEQSVSLPSGLQGLGRRLAVFALVVPVGFAATQWFAFALNTWMKGGAPIEANSVATMFMAQPVLWTGLMAWQMTRAGPREMIAAPTLVVAGGLLVWLAA